jgi:uncharacterized repeat protein (TIGR02543 family)
MNRFAPKPALYSAHPRTGLFPTAIIAAFALILAACSLPFCPATPEGTTTGGFSLSPRGCDGRTIMPTDLSVSKYSLSGSGPNGVTLPAQDSSTGDFTATGLAPGDWTLRVEGSDADKNIVLTGETKVTIAAGKTTGATITLLPATSGTGTLSLSVTWAGTNRTAETVTGSLTPTGGATISFDFTVADTTATCEQTGLAPGSYILVIELKTGGVRVARPLTEAVIVYNGKIAQWSHTLEAADFLPDYRVLYDANGAETGTEPEDSNRYVAGMPVTAATGNDLARSDTVFVGWNTKANGSGTSYAPGAVFAIGSADVTLYAMWNTIFYDGNGNTAGSVPVEQKAYATGDTVTVLGNTGNLVLDGYVFSGWLDNSSGTTYQPGDTFTKADGFISLFAVWRAGYTLSYDANNADSGTVPATFACLEGDTITIAGNDGTLVRAGYIFKGWNTDPSGCGTDYSPGMAQSAENIMSGPTMTLYAKWTPVYTVTYSGNGNTSGTVPVDGNSYSSTMQFTVSGNTGNLAKTGFIFAGWNSLPSGSGLPYAINSKYTMGTANRILYAKWTPVYTVTYNGNGQTTGTVPTDSNTYISTAKFTALDNTGNLAKTGYVFAGWNSLPSGEGESFAVGTNNVINAVHRILYARWVPKVTGVNIGYNKTFIYTEQGDLWATGSFYSWASGNASLSSSSHPVKIRSDGAKAYDFFWDAPYINSFLLFPDGTLQGSGYNGQGALGLGTTEPVDAMTTCANSVRTIAGNSTATLVLKSDGSLWAAGANGFGELATGDTSPRTTLTETQFTDGVKAVAAGSNHTLVLKNDGTLWTVGHNEFGQLGDGTTTDSSTPIHIASSVAAIDADKEFSVYLTTDGDLYGFGWNACGQFGDGTTDDKYTPYKIASGVATMTAGGCTVFYLTETGELWGIGGDTGWSGSGSSGSQYVPVKVFPSGVLSVATDGHTTFVVKTDGSLWGAGNGSDGELGLGYAPTVNTFTQILF